MTSFAPSPSAIPISKILDSLCVFAGIGLETDIYAFGIVMWEVWTRCFAWHWMGANAQFQICNRVGVLKQRPRTPPFIGTQSSKIAAMIRKCLHHEPAKRPTAAQLVEAQLETVKKIRRSRMDSRGPVREASHHDLAHQSSSSSTGSVEADGTLVQHSWAVPMLMSLTRTNAFFCITKRRF